MCEHCFLLFILHVELCVIIAQAAVLIIILVTRRDRPNARVHRAGHPSGLHPRRRPRYAATVGPRATSTS